MQAGVRFSGVTVCVLLFCAVGISAQEQRSGRIVGGRNADIADHPHMLLLRRNGHASCGAVVIGAKYALTAAHCVYPASNTSTVMSPLKMASTTQTGSSVEFTVERFMVHPKYLDSANDYDIAIIEISNEFSGYENVAPITLQNTEPSSSSAVCH
uniref:Peptidase S1 domain-containing protein n=1 Tax=Anopheles maculatus TaxID=74869 RepID=A0A182SK99_9DIPT